jgi:hypothetical protein
VFVGFYVCQGIVIGHRSGDFPDGAFYAWFYYTVSEADNYLTVPAGWLVDAVMGWPSMTSWLLAYWAGTAGYVVVGIRLWRGRRFRPAGYRAILGYLMLSIGLHLLTLIIVVPGAVDAVRTGENAPVYPYPGATMIHAYEWLLLPWSLCLPAITVAVAALLRAAPPGNPRTSTSAAP